MLRITLNPTSEETMREMYADCHAGKIPTRAYLNRWTKLQSKWQKSIDSMRNQGQVIECVKSI